MIPHGPALYGRGRKRGNMKNMKSIRKTAALFLTMAFISMICLAVIPADIYAADTGQVPERVIAALERIVDVNGRAIVVDNTSERMFLFKRSAKTGEWKCKKSFRCVCSDYLRPDRHYYLPRRSDTDKKNYKAGSRTYKYEIGIKCHEKEETHPLMIRSYVRIGSRIYKNRKKNNFGFCISESNASYIKRYYGSGTPIIES